MVFTRKLNKNKKNFKSWKFKAKIQKMIFKINQILYPEKKEFYKKNTMISNGNIMN